MIQEQVTNASGGTDLVQKTWQIKQEEMEIRNLMNSYHVAVLDSVEQNEEQYRQANENRREKMLQIAVVLLLIGIGVLFTGVFVISVLLTLASLAFFAQAQELKEYEPKEEYINFKRKNGGQ